MDLTTHVRKRAVLPALKADSREEALRELSHALLSGKNKGLRESVLAQVMTREALDSTALGPGIALPHARVSDLEDLVCAIGVSQEGLDFRASDDQRAHVVFLMLYPPSKQSVYLNFVAGLVRALHGSDRMQAMQEATDSSAILEILRQGVDEILEAEKVAVGNGDGLRALNVDGLAGGELFLLARLELYGDMLSGAKRGKVALQRRLDGIRALVSERMLHHYDRLRQRGGPALVTFEGGVCQGCSVKLPSRQAQDVCRDMNTVATCGHCQRFLYPI